jgi:hypothetical protein
MPELPEVATQIRALTPRIRGLRVRHAFCDATNFLDDGTPAALAQALTGLVVGRVARRGKYVRFDFVPPPAGDPLYEGVKRPPAVGDSVAALRPATLEAVGTLPPHNTQSGPLSRAEVRGHAEAAARAAAPPTARLAARRALAQPARPSQDDRRYFVMNDNGYPIPPRTRLLIAVESRTEDLLFGVRDTRRLARPAAGAGGDGHRRPARSASMRWAAASMARGWRRAWRAKCRSSWPALDRALAGLGNIYVTELLHRIKVHPERSRRRVDRGRMVRSAREMPKLLRHAPERWTESCRWIGPHGRLRRLPGRTARLWPRRGTLRPLRRNDHVHCDGGAGELLLPGVPDLSRRFGLRITRKSPGIRKDPGASDFSELRLVAGRTARQNHLHNGLAGRLELHEVEVEVAERRHRCGRSVAVFWRRRCCRRAWRPCDPDVAHRHVDLTGRT